MIEGIEPGEVGFHPFVVTLLERQFHVSATMRFWTDLDSFAICITYNILYVTILYIVMHDEKNRQIIPH